MQSVVDAPMVSDCDAYVAYRSVKTAQVVCHLGDVSAEAGPDQGCSTPWVARRLAGAKPMIRSEDPVSQDLFALPTLKFTETREDFPSGYR